MPLSEENTRIALLNRHRYQRLLRKTNKYKMYVQLQQKQLQYFSVEKLMSSALKNVILLEQNI